MRSLDAYSHWRDIIANGDIWLLFVWVMVEMLGLRCLRNIYNVVCSRIGRGMTTAFIQYNSNRMILSLTSEMTKFSSQMLLLESNLNLISTFCSVVDSLIGALRNINYWYQVNKNFAPKSPNYGTRQYAQLSRTLESDYLGLNPDLVSY